MKGERSNLDAAQICLNIKIEWFQNDNNGKTILRIM